LRCIGKCSLWGRCQPFDATPFAGSTGRCGPGADSKEKRAPVSDINTALVNRLKALDPNRPISEADIGFELCFGVIMQ
jgi:hypothetical protein